MSICFLSLVAYYNVLINFLVYLFTFLCAAYYNTIKDEQHTITDSIILTGIVVCLWALIYGVY